MIDFDQLQGFDWDLGNIEKSWFKHKVHFRECEEVFKHYPVLFHDEQHSQRENRFSAFGQSDQGRLLTVIFTIRENKIRVISARDMNRKERSIYVKEKTTESNSSV